MSVRPPRIFSRSRQRAGAHCLIALAGSLGVLVASAYAGEPFGDTGLEPTRRTAISGTVCDLVAEHFAHASAIPDVDLREECEIYRANAAAAEDRRAFDLATLRFVARLRNGHTWFSDSWLSREHGQPLGFHVAPLEGQWIVRASRLEGLEPGDAILAVDGMPIEEFVAERLPFVSASSERAARWSVLRASLFPPRFTLALADGRELEIDRIAQTLGPLPPRETTGRWIDRGDVAYLRVPSFDDARFEAKALELLRTYASARALIVDVRGNGGGSTPVRLIRALMDRPYRGWLITEEARSVKAGAMGRMLGPLQRAWSRLTSGGPRYRGELVVLVDEGCASACEDFVMPFKDNGRAMLVGDTTFGSSGQPFIHDFGNGMRVGIGARRQAFPDGSPYEGVGIAPDVPVRLSAEHLREGRDPILEKALELSRAR